MITIKGKLYQCKDLRRKAKKSHKILNKNIRNRWFKNRKVPREDVCSKESL